jgi:hypothetical protein
MSIESPIISMASRSEKKKKSEKSQEELREAFESRFASLSSKTKVALDQYDQMLANGDFDDQENEEAGAGEIRKEKAQAILLSQVDKLEEMKRVLDSGENLLQSTPEISVDYNYKDEGGKNKTETINLSLENSLAQAITLYQKTGIELPPDFQEQMETIWENNYDAIVEAVEKYGFNEILLAPENIPLPELSEKMKIENGYCDWIDSSGNTVESLPATTIISQRVDKPRIILYHKATLPELEARGIPTHLEITAGEAEKLYKQNPDNYLGTLEDAIILERKHFEETGEHLSDYTKGKGQWLSGTKSGSRFVYATWGPSDGELYVNANDPGNSRSDLGCRPSRYFF